MDDDVAEAVFNECAGSPETTQLLLRELADCIEYEQLPALPSRDQVEEYLNNEEFLCELESRHSVFSRMLRLISSDAAQRQMIA
jgi:hypothetical protein